ncbi:MAG: hypothetical protein K2N63_02555 [Lachnospiraceae bacterium]|nr:hypothetical protein [Lachnospiraceae bacterium]
MCKAIKEMQREAEQIGEQIGEQRGKQIGEQIGRQEGELKKAKESAKKLHEMGFAIEKTAQVVDYPVEEVKEWLGLV